MAGQGERLLHEHEPFFKINWDSMEMFSFIQSPADGVLGQSFTFLAPEKPPE